MCYPSRGAKMISYGQNTIFGIQMQCKGYTNEKDTKVYFFVANVCFYHKILFLRSQKSLFVSFLKIKWSGFGLFFFFQIRSALIIGHTGSLCKECLRLSIFFPEKNMGRYLPEEKKFDWVCLSYLQSKSRFPPRQPENISDVDNLEVSNLT